MSDVAAGSVIRRTRCARFATFLLVLLVIGPLCGQQTPRRQPHSVSDKTSAAFGRLKPFQDSKDWNGMLKVLEDVGVEPGSYDEVVVLDMKAKIYGMMDQFTKALQPWEKALQISDAKGYFTERQTLEIVFYLAQLYAQEASTTKDPAKQNESFARSLTHFRRFLQQTPKPTAEAMMTYASILFYKATANPNKVDQALLTESRAIIEKGLTSAIKPKDGFYQLLLALQQQQNDFLGASETLELILKQKPDKKDYWAMLMSMYLQLSERAKEDKRQAQEYLVRAIVSFERAQALGYLTTTKDHMNLVSLYFMANQFTKGTEMLYQGMKKGAITSEPNNWRLLGRYYQEANMNEQAAAALLEGAGLFPKNSEIEVQLAQLYTQMEQPRKALEHAKAAVAKGNFESTKPFSVYYLMAYTAYDLGDYEQAKAAMAAAEKYAEDAKKDVQFPKLKAAIEDAIAEREAKAKEKQKKAAYPHKATASVR